MKVPISRQKKNSLRFSQRTGRKIIINGIRWKWKVTRYALWVVAYSEKGGRQIEKGHVVAGVVFVDDTDFDDMDYFDDYTRPDYYFDIRPKDVARWLMTKDPSEIK